MSRYHVYGFGNALVDLEFEIPEELLQTLEVDKGLMTLIDEDRHHALLDGLNGIQARPCGGGSAANTMTAIAQLGGKAFYSCKVANDTEGRFFIDDLSANGLETNLTGAALASGVTGKCIVLVTPDAERSMNTHLGITSTLSTAELEEDAIRQSDHVYLEGYPVTEPNSLEALIRVRDIAQGASVPVALTLSDVNMVKFFGDDLRSIIGGGLDLIFSNEDEASLMTETTDINSCVNCMKALAKRFVVTRGSKGAVLYDGANVIEVAADAVTPVDSNGAGDIYAGAFLYALTQGRSFRACGELAADAARELILNFGARLPADRMRQVGLRHAANA